ncbi:hypothetical protein EFP20_16530 [Burkholderia glumae]|nr:hypothetical protein NCPPB3923_08670 [Burkholderia glumae]PJO21483.1 hypothetical protein Y5A_019330 [Burkholderia glumae AU6208]PNL04705.1 hypothetical protein CEQ24_001720 [Burkholderia glumae]QHP93910.1 hypothetical protein EXE55_23980 [Burkholderia glumae]UVS92523.1 hypothetical protein EFP17_22620 [Burkholderia glumae]
MRTGRPLHSRAWARRAGAAVLRRRRIATEVFRHAPLSKHFENERRRSGAGARRAVRAPIAAAHTIPSRDFA